MKTLRYFLFTLAIIACASIQLGAMEQTSHQQQPFTLTKYFLLKHIAEQQGMSQGIVTCILLPQLYIDYGDFVEHYQEYGVNRMSRFSECKKTLLFSQAYLAGVLTLLERLIGKPIVTVNLCHNKLTELPAEIGSLVNLQELWLGYNQLTVLPASIGNLGNLQVLYLSGNNLTVLPAEIGKLVTLKGLWLGRNQLTVLPAEIGKLVNLEWLWLESNQLTVLPEWIGNLVNLKTLVLRGNQLTKLPAEIGNLVNLEKLLLSCNQLTDEEIEKVKQLFAGKDTRIYF